LSLIKEIESLKSTPVNLSDVMEARLAARFGAPLGGLRVFEDEGLGDMGQRGYARGNEIHLAEGELGRRGDEVLLHEAGHVVQSGMGLLRGDGVLHNTGLEMQADAGFAAAPDFSMPASGDGPVLGFDWFWRKRRADARARRDADERNQAETMAKAIVNKNRPPDAATGAAAQSEVTPSADFGLLNGKLMRKNMTHMRRVQSDFGVNVSDISTESRGMGEHTIADADPGNFRIRYNPSTNRTPAAPKQGEGSRRYGFNATNNNYTGAHEYGHLVNFALIKKVYGDGEYNDDANENLTARQIAVTAGMRAAQKSRTFRKALAAKAGVDPNKELQYYTDDERSKLKLAITPKNLHEMDYTSEYGATNDAELMAEAFADRYRTTHKREKEKSRPFSFLRGKTKSNPFSREMVHVSRGLMKSEAHRKTFRDEHVAFRSQARNSRGMKALLVKLNDDWLHVFSDVLRIDPGEMSAIMAANDELNAAYGTGGNNTDEQNSEAIVLYANKLAEWRQKLAALRSAAGAAAPATVPATAPVPATLP
jgi:hypothetical protein